MTIYNTTTSISNGGTINITPTQDPGSTVDSAYDLGVLNFDNGTVTVQQTVGYNPYIDTGDGYQLYASSFDPADVYQFTLDEAGEYSLTLDGLDANADLFLLAENNEESHNPYEAFGEDLWDNDYYYLYDPGYVDVGWGDGLDTSVELPYDSALSYSTSLDTEPESINIELDPGTYYVGVYSSDILDFTNYSLTLSDNIWTSNTNSNSNIVPEQDPGTDFNSAYNLGVIETNLTIGETVSSSDRTDLYQLTIEQADHYNISLDELNADADLVLLDSYYQTIGVSQNYDSASELVSSNLDPGTYYVGVYSYDGIETNYELDIADAII